LVVANLVHTTDGREGGDEMSSLLGGVKPMKIVNGVLLAVLSLLCVHEASTADKHAKPQHAQAESDEHYYFHDTEQPKPHAAEWGYSGKIGPSHWGQLSPEFVLATDGKRQSPIDIRNTLSKPLPKLDFQYRPSRVHLVYNGHTIQENEDPGSFGLANNKFELRQFHFHAPSEHTIAGKHFPMEMHLVHKAQDGTSGVVAVFIQEGEHNRAFDPVWDNLPDANRPKQEAEIEVDTLSLLPKDTSYYAYDGSFTTPPCTEQVKWVVLIHPVNLSKQQIERFRHVIHDNNRPVQPLNGRPVFRSQQQ
jgi:carbonic anhydrase